MQLLRLHNTAIYLNKVLPYLVCAMTQFCQYMKPVRVIAVLKSSITGLK